jgi:hypothetical protein
MWRKLKYILADDRWFWFLCTVCLLIIAFWLGRISVQIEAVRTQTPVQSVTQIQRSHRSPFTVTGTNAPLVAARSGARYYSKECSGAARIAKENRLYFTTVDHVRAAGYTPAARCDFAEDLLR